MNEKNETAAGAGAPTAAVTQMGMTTASDSNRLEIERFMPVMDIAKAIARRQMIVEATNALMKKDVDFGKIPGCDRDVLLQPGADKLCNLFGLVINYEVIRREEDWTGEFHGNEPFFFYEICAKAYRGEFLMGEGSGSCNSREPKYRWRKGERTCPLCRSAAIIKGKEDYGGGWLCFKKKGGCGQLFKDGDQAIEGQTVGRKPNPDIAELVNTFLKMAYKRAKVAAAINATSASEFFTQDMEDFTVEDERPAPDTGSYPMGTAQAAQHVAAQKISTGKVLPQFHWRTMRHFAEDMAAARERVGEKLWLDELSRYGWRNFQDMRKAIDANNPHAREKAAEIFEHLSVAQKAVA